MVLIPNHPKTGGRGVSSVVEHLSPVWEIPGSIPGGGLACDLLQLTRFTDDFLAEKLHYDDSLVVNSHGLFYWVSEWVNWVFTTLSATEAISSRWDDVMMMMNNLATGTQCPALLEEWHGFFTCIMGRAHTTRHCRYLCLGSLINQSWGTGWEERIATHLFYWGKNTCQLTSPLFTSRFAWYR